MSRRNRRAALRWIFVMLAFFGLTVACAPEPRADDGAPEGVRIQTFDIRAGYCIVATHDTSQGASIAMWCTN
ncbi:hypothetical protein SEA_SCHATZIE_147 [Mycobacterium phage Schatzie]|nr:hypothetical protein SEA_DMPSTRDIVER_152 [Mycobacterium phage DmpstrDiver]QCO93836.1 hypothetical protein SEA_SCHATZIE_147 [Mycobacterium phage Schatzie]QDM57968.1 hypothetical protein SEA_NIHILNOMEN_153 [Mycobacterium phage NihilNomen]QQM15301.1 membrane protein [Mycobacterium phage Pound]